MYISNTNWTKFWTDRNDGKLPRYELEFYFRFLSYACIGMEYGQHVIGRYHSIRPHYDDLYLLILFPFLVRGLGRLFLEIVEGVSYV